MSTARDRAREADLLRFGLGEVEAVEPEPGEDAALAAEEARLGFADELRTAAEQAREALSSEQDQPDALGHHLGGPRRLLDGVRDHDTEAGELADRLAEISYLLSDVAADVASYASAPRDRPGPAGRRLRAPGGAHRADPQVRRDHRRGAGLGRAVGDPAPRARPHRRADRGAARRARRAARAARRRRPRRCRRPAPTAAARLADEVTAELALLAMPRRADRGRR